MSIEEAADFHYNRAFDLVEDERYKEAEQHLLRALEINPRHTQALIDLGELYLWDCEELEMELPIALREALRYYERAIAVEWKLAEAWAGKADALGYLGRHEEALEAAETGLLVLPLCLGYYMNRPEVHTNVAEALFNCKVEALRKLGREGEARKALGDGLEYCPGSDYLGSLTKHFAPDLGPPNGSGDVLG